MLAYNKEKLENGLLVSEAKELYKMKFISKTQLSKIAKQLPLLQSNGNLLVRIGFFLLGCFLFSSVMGSFMLLFAPLMENNYKVMVYLYALIGLVGTELLAAKNYHKHGLDDAFVLSMQGSFYGAVGLSMEDSLPVFIMMIVVGLVCCIRYVHTLSALISCVGVVGLLFDLITEHHLMDTMFLPFVGFLLAIGIYFIYSKLHSNPKCDLYANALRVTKVFSLVLGYFSLNYMVVRELSQSLMGIIVEEGADIPLAFLFYGFTFIVPLFYIGYSVYSKDRMMLIVGVLTLGYSFFTIRYYHQLLPLEIALLLGGVVLFVVVFAAIRVLKHKETGVTFKPDRSSDSNLLLNAQALILSTQADMKPVAAENKMPFGGGGFSGGGAGETY